MEQPGVNAPGTPKITTRFLLNSSSVVTAPPGVFSYSVAAGTLAPTAAIVFVATAEGGDEGVG